MLAFVFAIVFSHQTTSSSFSEPEESKRLAKEVKWRLPMTQNNTHLSNKTRGSRDEDTPSRVELANLGVWMIVWNLFVILEMVVDCFSIDLLLFRVDACASNLHFFATI